MTLSATDIEFEILESKIRSFDTKFELFVANTIKTIENDNLFKGFYNSKIHRIIETDNEKEFIDFQSFLKNHNNKTYIYSLILMIFSAFETSLKTICYFVQDHSTPYLPFTEPHQKILINCKKYLSKTIDFNSSEININFTIIERLNIVRNLIAHNDGNLIKNKDFPLERQIHYEQIKADKMYDIHITGQIYITDTSYISNTNKVCGLIIKSLIDQLKNANNKGIKFCKPI
ncbi:hypothetical protein JW887_06210 [Candidatus Dojkabacteria bacterium]|nr:hypothetical protein [Candidatus Dojkabacteria bacterium]